VAETGEDIVGFVSFDARAQTVHVTQIEGTTDACQRLLEEPVGFARRERMSVELLVPESSDNVREAVLGSGFNQEGTGPTFEGTPTIRYRMEP
jgi:hypothetical protein